MKQILLAVILVSVLAFPAAAQTFTAPEAPPEAEDCMPGEPESFAEGLWFIIKKAIALTEPDLAQAASVCLSVIAVVILVAIIQSFSDQSKGVTELAGTLAVTVILLQPANALIALGANVITSLYEYGKLLLPVMTGALAAQGGYTASGALYTGTAFFCSLMNAVISRLGVPMLYLFLALSIAGGALGEDTLQKMRDFIKWSIQWILRIILYVFTAYMTITGVISGTADASAVKAAKLAISGSVPVVGKLLSDASETILISAGIMKNAAGLYGLLAISAVWMGPFLRIGVQYLLLKLTAGVCGVIGTKRLAGVIQDISCAMGLIMAMTGTVCLMLLISTVCFMKGVS